MSFLQNLAIVLLISFKYSTVHVVINAFSPRNTKYGQVSIAKHHRPIDRITLFGGYDATIGADPNSPIQIYCSMKKNDEETSTLICLSELELNFQIIEIIDPKPDWFLRIHPSGSTPCVRNPADTDEIIFNLPPGNDDVNEYLCDFFEAIGKGPCPLRPMSKESHARLEVLQQEFDTATKSACLGFVSNIDADSENQRRDEMEKSLYIYEEELCDVGDFLLGNTFSLLDVRVISSLQPILSKLKKSKNYMLPRESFPNVTRWLKRCAQRTSVDTSLFLL
jgi:glutathione S-transferase